MAEIKMTKGRRKKETSRTDDVATGFAQMSTSGMQHEPSNGLHHQPLNGGPRVNGRQTMRDIDEDERRRMIAEAAYYRAQRRGFANGSPESDWLEAEAEIVALLANAGLRA